MIFDDTPRGVLNSEVERIFGVELLKKVVRKLIKGSGLDVTALEAEYGIGKIVDTVRADRKPYILVVILQ